MRWWEQLFAKQRPPGGILPEGYHPPPRVLSGWDLTAMGIGATIGAGIFVTAGQVALTAGPGVILSFVIAGCGCALAGLCYAEFAALAPTGGSAYSYAYSTMGELLAWIVGWDLVLEYAFAGSIVAVEWSLNLVALLEALGVQVPRWLVDLEIPIAANYVVHVNFITMLIISIVTYILILGVKESARENAVMVVVKVGVVLLVICAGVWFVVPANWLNAPGAPAGLMPNGFAAVMTGAAVVFFSYIGFDAVSTHAEETVAPGRNLPLGILGSLVICTVLYIGVAVVLIGMVPWPQMPREAPVVNAFIQLGGWVARIAGIVIGIGAIAGMTSVILITFSGQARIFRAMARDGLLPRRIFAVQH
ncbi:MAG TPA: amino acid permease, partial [Gemmata sp.]|nr:amino acid permease [Gemmata sp.]